MTPQQMLNAAYKVQQRWPAANIKGFFGNAAVSLDVVVEDQIVARIDCHDGSVQELARPVLAAQRHRGIYITGSGLR